MYGVQGIKAAKYDWHDEKITKPNFNLCMQERLTILKKIRDKRLILMNKNSDIYGACWHKTTFHWYCISTYDPIFNVWKG